MDVSGKKRGRKEMERATGSASSSSSAPVERKSGGAVASTAARTTGISGHKSRVLVFGGRGITARFRHLMLDLRTMITHHKKESKVR